MRAGGSACRFNSLLKCRPRAPACYVLWGNIHVSLFHQQFGVLPAPSVWTADLPFRIECGLKAPHCTSRMDGRVSFWAQGERHCLLCAIYSILEVSFLRRGTCSSAMRVWTELCARTCVAHVRLTTYRSCARVTLERSLEKPVRLSLHCFWKYRAPVTDHARCEALCLSLERTKATTVTRSTHEVPHTVVVSHESYTTITVIGLK